MTKSAWLGLTIALFVPVICYYIVSGFGEGAVNMPRRYFDDSVVTKVVNGKTINDTIWHRIPHFELTNQLAQTITPDSLNGKIWVVSTFFTHCPNICPGLTRNIKKLQKSFENRKRKKYGDTSLVYFISLTVDPARDSVEALKKWADRFYVNSDNWSLLTGPKKDIYSLLLNDFRLSAQDGEGVDSNFIHTEKVMLVDKNRVVRGFYNGLDSLDMGRLAGDIGKLYLERDRKKPSIFRAYLPILPLLVAVPVIVFVVMYFLGRSRKKTELLA
ncbi:MAG: SCO family protein [Bacteroidetes bacterium]|nr:MAG: SCO family protein [Bacteroidota bacterium]